MAGTSRRPAFSDNCRSAAAFLAAWARARASGRARPPLAADALRRLERFPLATSPRHLLEEFATWVARAAELVGKRRRPSRAEAAALTQIVYYCARLRLAPPLHASVPAAIALAPRLPRPALVTLTHSYGSAFFKNAVLWRAIDSALLTRMHISHFSMRDIIRYTTGKSFVERIDRGVTRAIARRYLRLLRDEQRAQAAETVGQSTKVLEACHSKSDPKAKGGAELFNDREHSGGGVKPAIVSIRSPKPGDRASIEEECGDDYPKNCQDFAQIKRRSRAFAGDSDGALVGNHQSPHTLSSGGVWPKGSDKKGCPLALGPPFTTADALAAAKLLVMATRASDFGVATAVASAGIALAATRRANVGEVHSVSAVADLLFLVRHVPGGFDNARIYRSNAGPRKAGDSSFHNSTGLHSAPPLETILQGFDIEPVITLRQFERVAEQLAAGSPRLSSRARELIGRAAGRRRRRVGRTNLPDLVRRLADLEQPAEVQAQVAAQVLNKCSDLSWYGSLPVAEVRKSLEASGANVPLERWLNVLDETAEDRYLYGTT